MATKRIIDSFIQGLTQRDFFVDFPELFNSFLYVAIWILFAAEFPIICWSFVKIHWNRLFYARVWEERVCVVLVSLKRVQNTILLLEFVLR